MTIIVALILMLQADAAAQLGGAVQDGIEAGAFPGAVVVVGTADTILLARGYGHFTWSAESPVPDPDSTLFDLASLTKVVATTPSLMKLVESGELDLDSPVQRYVPGFTGEGKESVTVRHLLEHRSGLRAFLPLNERTANAAEARALVEGESLRWKPASRVEYSDLNTMLAGWVVESVSGLSLDEYAVKEIFSPIGMSQTLFRPSQEVRGRISPVGLWRGHVIAGELHDQNAVRLGGVSGHAGLYSTGLDLARYAQLLLNHGRGPRGQRHFDSTTVRVFTTRGSGNRALGWEMRDTTDVANTGRLLSPSAFGHTGFTGTSIWIDPETDLFIVVLTNRVFAPKTGRSITILKEVRGKVADAAVALRSQICGTVEAGGRGRRGC